MLRLIVLLACVLPAFAQLPEFYKTVNRVTWVTKDTARAAAAWEKLGLTGLETPSETAMPVEFRGKPATARIRYATATLGNVVIDFVEPLGGENAWSEFLARHGEGVFALMHETGTREALEAEVARLRGLGVSVLQRAGDPAPHVYFDTAPRGKYVLALCTGSPRDTGPARISQWAFAVREIGPVSDYWKSLGWPAISVNRSTPRDMMYRGKPVQQQFETGWQRHGTVPYEWCVPPAGGPSVYREFIDRHGEGIQHFGINVPDMDKAIAETGFAVVQSGAWGEPGKKGSGRWAYLDTDPAGGLTAELLWNFR